MIELIHWSGKTFGNFTLGLFQGFYGSFGAIPTSTRKSIEKRNKDFKAHGQNKDHDYYARFWGRSIMYAGATCLICYGIKDALPENIHNLEHIITDIQKLPFWPKLGLTLAGLNIPSASYELYKIASGKKPE